MAYKSQHHLFQGLLPEHEVAALSSCEYLFYNGPFVPELGACSFWQVCQQSRSSLITKLFNHYFRKRKHFPKRSFRILCQYVTYILSGDVHVVEKHAVAL